VGRGGTSSIHIFLHGKGNFNHKIETVFFLHSRIISTVKRVEFVSERMYISIKGRWCDIILFYVHALTAEEDDVNKDSIYGVLEQVNHQYRKYHMKILIVDISAKIGREDIYKPVICNESIHEASIDNGVIVVNLQLGEI
jgi:predicted DNA-binding protein YlxM (UPF0122 family)